MPLHETEQVLLRRHPRLPAGLVVAAVARHARRHARRVGRPGEDFWPTVLEQVDEHLRLIGAVRYGPAPQGPAGDGVAREA